MGQKTKKRARGGEPRGVLHRQEGDCVSATSKPQDPQVPRVGKPTDVRTGLGAQCAGCQPDCND